MTWRKDGSGLDVKRVRGMTLPQREAARWGRPNPRCRNGRGRRCDTSWCQAERTKVRQRRRERRAKRIAKAAVRRLKARLWPLLDRWTKTDSLAMGARWELLMQFAADPRIRLGSSEADRALGS